MFGEHVDRKKFALQVVIQHAKSSNRVDLIRFVIGLIIYVIVVINELCNANELDYNPK